MEWRDLEWPWGHTSGVGAAKTPLAAMGLRCGVLRSHILRPTLALTGPGFYINNALVAGGAVEIMAGWGRAHG